MESHRGKNLDLVYFKTRTPKGDGNVIKFPHLLSPHDNFKTRTPKGDGNYV